MDAVGSQAHKKNQESQEMNAMLYGDSFDRDHSMESGTYEHHIDDYENESGSSEPRNKAAFAPAPQLHRGGSSSSSEGSIKMSGGASFISPPTRYIAPEGIDDLIITRSIPEPDAYVSNPLLKTVFPTALEANDAWEKLKEYDASF